MARKNATDIDNTTDQYTMDPNANPADDPNAVASIVEAEIDVTDAPPPDPLPKGLYPAQVNSAVIKVSQKGNRYVEVQFFIDPSSYPADFTEGNPMGMNLAYRRVDAGINPVSGKLTPRAAYQFGKFMKVLGMEGGMRINTQDWVGREARVRIDHRPGQQDKNELFPDIVEVLPA